MTATSITRAFFDDLSASHDQEKHPLLRYQPSRRSPLLQKQGNICVCRTFDLSQPIDLGLNSKDSLMIADDSAAVFTTPLSYNGDLDTRLAQFVH